jgi:ABC-type phosphate/phosphonate transport system substrate-binding protein
MQASSGLPQADHFFSDQKTKDNITQVVLPVFFRRADVACVARPGWETAVELNPQLGHDLVPLAVSPRVIPICFGFRKNTNIETRKALIASMQSITSFTAGQQIVELYQSRAFVIRPLTAINPTLEMLRQFERVSARTKDSRAGRRNPS